MVQQRNAQAELESERRQGQELTKAKSKLQAELANLQDKFEREKLARLEEGGKSMMKCDVMLLMEDHRREEEAPVGTSRVQDNIHNVASKTLRTPGGCQGVSFESRKLLDSS